MTIKFKKFWFIVSAVLFVSCSSDKFEFNISKGADANTKREVRMSVKMRVDPPSSSPGANPVIIKTENKLEAELLSSCSLKNKSMPGVFTFSDKVQKARFFMSHEQNTVGESSISMTYQDGKYSVENKIQPGESAAQENENGIESKGRQAFSKMIELSEQTSAITVDRQGNILFVDAEAEVVESINRALQTYSGAFGIIFSKNKIKVGDTWTEKKSISYFNGMQINEPAEIEVTFKRMKDEKLEGRKVAVFTSRYSVDKKNVPGSFGGMPVNADIKGETEEVLYFDLSEKFMAKTDRRTEEKIVSTGNNDSTEAGRLKISIEVDSYSRNISVVPYL